MQTLTATLALTELWACHIGELLNRAVLSSCPELLPQTADPSAQLPAIAFADSKDSNADKLPQLPSPTLASRGLVPLGDDRSGLLRHPVNGVQLCVPSCLAAVAAVSER